MGELKVGDKRWYIPGYRMESLIAILCTVKEVDMTFREKHPDGVIFYWLDEPVGHAVTEDELHLRDNAMSTLMGRYEDELDEDELVLTNAQLAEFRKQNQKFIADSWKHNGEEHPGFTPLPEKQLWEEWVNPQMILDKRKQPLKGSAIQVDGKTYAVLAPGRHNHVINKILTENPDVKTPIVGTQGFITQDDRFVDRIEGARIALETGQIKQLNWPPELFSEDLW